MVTQSNASTTTSAAAADRSHHHRQHRTRQQQQPQGDLVALTVLCTAAVCLLYSGHNILYSTSGDDYGVLYSQMIPPRTTSSLQTTRMLLREGTATATTQSSLQHNGMGLPKQPESSEGPATSSIGSNSNNSTRLHPSDKPNNIFFVWLGNKPLDGIHAAAIDSCRRMNENNFTITVVRDADLDTLGFELHPLFHLLDPVQKSDYLRQELLHYHGGIYLDSDVFCVRPLAPTLNRIGRKPDGTGQQQLVVGGGSPHLPYGDLNNNMIGPNLPRSHYSSATHEALWQRMGRVADQLRQCAADFPDGAGGIAYPDRIGNGKQLCGTKWGVLIDFNKRRTRQAYKVGTLVETFVRCDENSQPGTCDLLHIGCAKGRGRSCKDRAFVCQRTPILRETRYCTKGTAAELS